MLTNNHDILIQLLDKLSLEADGYDRILDLVSYAHAILDRLDNLDIAPSAAFPTAIVDSIQNRISVLCECAPDEANAYLDDLSDFILYAKNNMITCDETMQTSLLDDAE